MREFVLSNEKPMSRDYARKTLPASKRAAPIGGPMGLARPLVR